MRDILAGLDLNLLLSLHAVLQEESVSKAAVRLHVSQPTVSVALRRLRAVYSDDLLTRRGNRWELTPLAVDLAPRAAAAVEAVRGVFGSAHEFDPAVASREFTVQGNDHAAATLGVRATEIVQREAPKVSFRFTNAASFVVSPEMADLERVDAALLPTNLLPGADRQEIMWDHWVCLAAAGSGVPETGMTLGQMDARPWVVTHQSRDTPRPALMQLRMLGITPRVVASVDSFLALPAFVIGTDRLALVPSRLAEVMCRESALEWWLCPYDAVQMTVAMYWHPKHTADPAHEWMRGVLATAGRLSSRQSDAAGAPGKGSADGGRTDQA